MKALLVEVVGLSHESTAARLEDVLRRKAGVLFARVDFASRQVTIHFDEHLLSESTLRALVREWGYGDPIRTPGRSEPINRKHQGAS